MSPASPVPDFASIDRRRFLTLILCKTLGGALRFTLLLNVVFLVLCVALLDLRRVAPLHSCTFAYPVLATLIYLPSRCILSNSPLEIWLELVRLLLELHWLTLKGRHIPVVS